MALKDTSTIQEMDFKKIFHPILRQKNFMLTGIKNASSMRVISFAKFFAINTQIFLSILTLDFYISSVLENS